MFVCPVCRVALEEETCPSCQYRVEWRGEIPCFFTSSEISARYRTIADFYDHLYSPGKGDTWECLAERGKVFNQFIATLIERTKPIRYLDIGCGEGQLIRTVSAKEKYGMDLSYRGLETLRKCADAKVCVAFAEELPYATEYFDAISSIGVMTHFLDDIVASEEINRVLKPGGRYVVGVYVKPGRIADFGARLRSVFQDGKGMGTLLLKTVSRFGKISNFRSFEIQSERKDKQPIERYYTHKKLLDIFLRAGFELEELITKLRRPDAPLAGQHFRIYVLKKGRGA